MAEDTDTKTRGKPKKAVVEDLDPAAFVEAVNKHFGPGTMMLGDDESLKVRRMSTGSLAIDNLLEGGIVRGRHVEVYGSAQVAKTTFGLKCLVEAQRAGGRGAYVDTERTYNPEFARHLGMDLTELAYHQQQTGPRCIDFIEALLRSDLYDVIVVDSIAALVPLEDLETDMEKSSYGMQQAKMMSKALRKLTAVNTGRTTIIWINQTRESISAAQFGPKTVTSAGRAMGFYASTRLEFVMTETLNRKEPVVDQKTGEIKTRERTPYGKRIMVKAVKEKTGARPMAETTVVFNFDLANFDPIEDLLFIGREFGFVHKKGNMWWVDEYDKHKKNGRKKFIEFLRDDKKGKEIAAELEGWIRDNIGEEAA